MKKRRAALMCMMILAFVAVAAFGSGAPSELKPPEYAYPRYFEPAVVEQPEMPQTGQELRAFVSGEIRDALGVYTMLAVLVLLLVLSICGLVRDFRTDPARQLVRRLEEQKGAVQRLCTVMQEASERIAGSIDRSGGGTASDMVMYPDVDEDGPGLFDDLPDGIDTLVQMGEPDPDWEPAVSDVLREELEERPWSKDGLRDRLREIANTYEYRWSPEMIDEALDDSEIDWKQEAVRALLDEVSGGHRFSYRTEYSYPALGRRLEKEYRFSVLEVRFALDNAGVDWAGQAVKCALGHLPCRMETDRELERALVSDGFSAQEAKDAVIVVKRLPEYLSAVENADSVVREKIRKDLNLFHGSRSHMIRSKRWDLEGPFPNGNDLSEEDEAKLRRFTEILDGMDIDWAREAQLNAEKVLREETMSRSGLISHLVDEEGFTPDEAEYAADNPYEYSRSWTSDFGRIP